MILFAAAWDLPIERREELVGALRTAALRYPTLDLATLQERTHGRSFLTWVSWPDALTAGRRPAHTADDATVLVHGYPAAPDYDARDASELMARWDTLPGDAEGIYTIVRASSEALEVITEPLGLEPVYVRRIGDAHVIASNVAVLADLAPRPPIDLAGAAQLVAIGWTAGARTLRAGVHAIESGARWRAGRGAVKYFDVEAIAGRAERRSIDEVGDSVARALAAAARPYPEILCGLTAGRDSRLVLALARAAKAPVKFFTSGLEESDDVRTARRLTEIAGVTFQHHPVPKDELYARWDELAARIVEQNDGLVSMWQIFDVMHQPARGNPDRLNLAGAGGEIGRGTYHDEATLWSKDPEQVAHRLLKRLVTNHGGLVTPVGFALARTEMHDTIRRLSDSARHLADVPDLLYLIERVRRWGGALARRSIHGAVRYYPLMIRPFIVEAFARTAKERVAETLHHDLLRRLAPDLDEVPYANGPWKPRDNPFTAPPVPKPAHAFRQPEWLEQERGHLRAQILDRASSPLWDVIDRERFEAIMAPDVPAAERGRRAMGLYLVATLFEHERRFGA